MLADNTVPSTKIKVVTENGMVYLLGLITRAEANRATAVVQGVGGVQGIVRLFEYVD
ncbi:BON domain protein [compost metagenome]